MLAMKEEELNLVVGGVVIGVDEDLPEWWVKFKVCSVIVMDEYTGMTKQEILNDVISIWGKKSWEVQYAKKKLHMK